jgi:hypothetical protein
VTGNLSRRLATVATTALLGTMLLGAGTATAADSRMLYVGDPAQESAPPTPYQIHPTAVSVGNVTYFDVQIKNEGRQTLTSASLAMGTLIATSDGNGNFGQALPTGWTIKNITSLAPGISPTCVTDPTSTAPSSGLITAGAYDGFSCSFGNLSRNAGGTIRVYLTAGPGPISANDIQVSGKVAEATGGNVGSNTNTFYAYSDGTFFVSGDGRVAGLFDKTHDPIHPLVRGATPTTVALFALSGDYVVSIDETLGGPECPSTITTCSAGASTVHVNQGVSVNPYFVWTAQFPVSSTYKLSNKTGFIHFFETSGYETLYNVQKTTCSNPTIPCADFTLVNGGTSGAYVQVYFKTANNGSGKLF